MSRKVYLDVNTRLSIELDEGRSISDVMSEMDCTFNTFEYDVTVIESGIVDWKVTDSK